MGLTENPGAVLTVHDLMLCGWAIVADYNLTSVEPVLSVGRGPAPHARIR